jgi:hypothetical protein
VVSDDNSMSVSDDIRIPAYEQARDKL